MDLPARQDIDDMVALIGGPNASFDLLSIPDRMRVIELVNQTDAVSILSTIEDRIDRIDDHLVKVADWFRCSRTYEG